MKKKILYTVCFLLVFLTAFHLLNRVLYEKQHFGTAKNIDAEEAGKIDAFFVGSSHIFYGINPSEIWDTAGIAGYNLTTHQQPLWASRLLLEHALERQQPKLIVLDVLMATNFARPVLGTEQGTNMTHLALDPVPFSYQKVRGVLETDEIIAKSEILFPIMLTHTRLQQGLLSFRDFSFGLKPEPHPMKGYNFTRNTLSYDRPAPEAVSGKSFDLPEGAEPALRDFIEFCQEKDLPLLMIKTPVIVNDEFYMQINRIGEIAVEYGVPYLDLNQYFDELEMDPQTDWADTGHLNVFGAGKVSRYLGRYIADHYDLPDHRGDPDYADWEQTSQHYHNLLELPEVDSISEYLSRSADPNLLTMVASGGTSENEYCLNDADYEAFLSAGLTRFPQCGNTAYIGVLGSGAPREQLNPRKDIDASFMLEETRFYLHSSNRAPDGEARMVNLNVDSSGYVLMEPGILLLSFDKDTMTIVDAVKFTVAEGYEGIRKF